MPTTDAWLRAALSDALARGVELVSEVELFLRLTQARVLAVTGTKGKTTTTALIGAILDAAGMPHLLGGNIGRPLIEEVERLGPDDWAVLELSELQLPTISRGAEIAVYTNIGADHLDRHGTSRRLSGGQGASRRAERAARPRGAERRRPRLPRPGRSPARPPRSPGMASSPTDPWIAARLADGWLTVRGERVVAAAEMPIPGRHSLADALAAALATSLAGASNEAIAERHP